jgi:hypothetical protein
MPRLKNLLAAGAVAAILSAGAAHAAPLTYTLTYTEAFGGNGDSYGTAQFTIDSGSYQDATHLTDPAAITDFSATFYNVGSDGNTVSYTQGDLASLDFFTMSADTPPFLFTYFNSNDTSIYQDFSFIDGNDYLFGNPDSGFQQIVNDTSGLGVGYSTSIDGPPAPAPEPASLTLLSLGAGAMLLRRRRRA